MNENQSPADVRGPGPERPSVESAADQPVAAAAATRREVAVTDGTEDSADNESTVRVAKLAPHARPTEPVAADRSAPQLQPQPLGSEQVTERLPSPPTAPLFPVASVAPGSVSPGSVSPGSVSPGSVEPSPVAPDPVAPGAVPPGSAVPGSTPVWAVPSGVSQVSGSAGSAATPPPATAVPAGPAAEPSLSAVPLFRRRLVLALGGAGAAVLLAGAGFLAGHSYRGGDSTSLGSGPGAFGSGQGGGLAGGYAGGHGPQGGPRDQQGFPGGQGSGANGFGGRQGLSSMGIAVGRITAISGSAITLSGPGGDPIRVTTTSSTTVGGASGGSLSTLAVGQVLFVTGTRNNDGSIAATAVMTRATRFGAGGVTPDQQAPAGQRSQADQGLNQNQGLHQNGTV
jgi:Domain of unknown function (DUF5666)